MPSPCYENCLSLFMATKRVKLFIPTLPYLLNDYGGFQVLAVDHPLHIEQIGPDMFINGPDSCCNKTAYVTLDYTQCAINEFKARISNSLNIYGCMTISVNGGLVCEWESVSSNLNCQSIKHVFKVCGGCGCKEKTQMVVDCASVINADGETTLGDGSYKVYFLQMPDLTSIEFANLLQLMVEQYEFKNSGGVVSQSTSHGGRSSSTTRQAVDYDALIDKELHRHIRNRPIIITRGSASCVCPQLGRKFKRYDYCG